MRPWILVVGMTFALLTGCSAGAQDSPSPQPGKCVSDADCVPARCCHSTSCIHKSEAPDCSKVACTMNCEPGTMDCGGGRCECDGGACRARISGG